jgi:hypothetical protein
MHQKKHGGLRLDNTSRGADKYSVEVDKGFQQGFANNCNPFLLRKDFSAFLITRFGQPERQGHCKSAAHT